MATPKQIRQRFGWGLDRFQNVRDELDAAEAHFAQGMTALDEYIEEPSNPADPPDEPDPLPGTTEPPTFTAQEVGVRASWPAAENATHYRVTREGDPEGFDVDQTHAILPLSDGDWVCIEPRNATGAAEASCETYEAAGEPAPDPEPPSGEWTLVHDFSPALGETLPDGVSINLKDGSWVPGGKSERTTEGVRFIYLKGMEDGRGPGQIVIRFPAGHRRLMCEYEITLSADYEDHPIFNKIAHYRMKPHPDGSGSKTIDKWKNYRIGYATSSATATAGYHLEQFYPNYYAGYNSVHGNVRTDRLVPEQTHTVRCEWTWVRTDDDHPGVNWYRLRWWLDGALQGDFPEFPLLGGPEAHYWEIAPTWGGNGGHVKTREDWMLISRIATWVG